MRQIGEVVLVSRMVRSATRAIQPQPAMMAIRWKTPPKFVALPLDHALNAPAMKAGMARPVRNE